MKSTILIGVLILLSVRSAFCTTLDEFKQLPQSERDALVAASDGETRSELARWNWRLRFTEENWQLRQRERLVGYNGLHDIKVLFSDLRHLSDSFGLHEWIKIKKNHLSEKEILSEVERIATDHEKLCQQVEAFLPSVVPSRQAHDLDRKARALVIAWEKRWSYSKKTAGAPTKSELDDIDQVARDILDQLMGLPTMTEVQMQEAIKALPEDRPGGIVVSPPTS